MPFLQLKPEAKPVQVLIYSSAIDFFPSPCKTERGDGRKVILANASVAFLGV